MTDEQIIKALECCFSNESCEGCPLDTNDADSSCLRIIRNEAVHLCLRQQAEIERLEADREALINGQITLQKMYAEAIKEFAEEFEKRCIASGIYPAITKDLLKKLVKEKTEVSNGE